MDSFPEGYIYTLYICMHVDICRNIYMLKSLSRFMSEVGKNQSRVELEKCNVDT